ncbi:MAG TPA: L,D-transpeptidase family protein [Beijerinckiaceae bacterium]|jgi:murein L,D-transpeptidase YcbB/YkuD
MGAPRAAFVLVAVGCLTAALAARAENGTSSGPDLELPTPPEVTVSVEPRVSDRAAERPSEPVGEVAPPDLPAVTVAVPPAVQTVPSAAVMPQVTALPDVAPPDLPSAPVTITAADQATTALAVRLADNGFQLLPRLPRKEREAIAAFYALGAYQPIWVKDGAWTPAATAVIDRLKRAGEDALDATEYPIPALGVTARDSAADLAEAELKLSAAAVLYARDARGARIELSRLSSLITPKLEIPTADAVLNRLAASPDAGAALQAFNPPHEGYQALKRKLAELRATRPASTPMVKVPQGPALKLGMRDSRVPLVRARFNLGPATGDEAAYDERVASAVADFQREKGLVPDGVLTSKTIAALAGSSPARIEGDIIANMERWRWLPADMGERYIQVNVPEFRLRLMDRGRLAHQTRVIVGKTETQTPVFSEMMRYVIVNPSWHIPPSILKKEILPGLAADPFYAAKRGYEVVRRGDQISVRQPPGERNALGFIKLMFPNRHAVYLHDTPNRSLFRAERRAFSHGCVRVEQPFQLAEEVLGRAWTEERLKSLIGRGERTIHLPEPLPVHLTYFTIFVDERGELRSAADLYGHDQKVRLALGLGGTAVAHEGQGGVRERARITPPRSRVTQQAPRVERRTVPSQAPSPTAGSFWDILRGGSQL